MDPGGHPEAARRFGLLRRVERARGHGLTLASALALLGLARSTLNKALQACLDYCSKRRPHRSLGMRTPAQQAILLDMAAALSFMIGATAVLSAKRLKSAP